MLPADTPPGTRVAALHDMYTHRDDSLVIHKGEVHLVAQIDRPPTHLICLACKSDPGAMVLTCDTDDFMTCVCEWRLLDLPSTLTSLLTDTPILVTHEGPVRVDEPTYAESWRAVMVAYEKARTAVTPPTYPSLDDWARANERRFGPLKKGFTAQDVINEALRRMRGL